MAAFPQREAVLGRPVAVLVPTTREAVADRARLPAGGLAFQAAPELYARLRRSRERLPER